jgi:hypothetical protein
MTLLERESDPSARPWAYPLVIGQPAPRASDHGQVSTKRRWFSRFLTEGFLIWFLAFCTFFTVSMLFDFTYMEFPGDAVARMANGFYILHSRDPHLAAVGFVWNPGQSFAVLPLLLVNSLWSDLASHDVAGTTVSVVAMAGAVYQLHAALKEWFVGRAPRYVITFLFVANPMILLYGGDGMSEAGYIFLVVACARYLLRWLRDEELTSLVFAGTALGFGYLQRNECVGAALLAGPLVIGATYLRGSGARSKRIWSGLTDGVIFLLPVITTFVGWAVVSYVITGQPFGQFTSQYGNSAQLQSAGLVKSGEYGVRMAHEVTDLSYLVPLIPVVIVLVLVRGVLRKDFNQAAGVVAVVGGALAFSMVGYLDDTVFPWFRFYIQSLPLQSLLIGYLFSAPNPLRKPGGLAPPGAGAAVVAPSRSGARAGRVAASIGASLLCLVLLVPSVVRSFDGMLNPKVGLEEILEVGYILNKHQSALDRNYSGSYAEVRSMATYMDNMQLPLGDVIMDTADVCAPNLMTNVDDPRMFVITNDRDFQRVLADPLTFHAHYYILQVGGGASADAVKVAYPTASSREGWSKLIHTFPARGSCSGLQLYQVTGHPDLRG